MGVPGLLNLDLLHLLRGRMESEGDSTSTALGAGKTVAGGEWGLLAWGQDRRKCQIILTDTTQNIELMLYSVFTFYNDVFKNLKKHIERVYQN